MGYDGISIIMEQNRIKQNNGMGWNRVERDTMEQIRMNGLEWNGVEYNGMGWNRMEWNRIYNG